MTLTSDLCVLILTHELLHHIFSPCCSEEGEWESVWLGTVRWQPAKVNAPGRLSHQQSYNRNEDAVNIRFYIIKAFLCLRSLSRSSDFNLITVYWALKISFPLILFSQLSISTAEQTRLSAFGIDFCLTSATVQQRLYYHIIMFISRCAYILDFPVYVWKGNHRQPPWNRFSVRFMMSEGFNPLFCAKHVAACCRTTCLVHECLVTHSISHERSVVWNKQTRKPTTKKLWSGCLSFCATRLKYSNQEDWNPTPSVSVLLGLPP